MTVSSDVKRLTFPTTEEEIRKLPSGRKQQAVVAMPHAFGETRPVVECADWDARAKQIRNFHRNVEA